MKKSYLQYLVVLTTSLMAGCGGSGGQQFTVNFGGATYTCNGEAGCCCNSPIQHNNPGAGSWPDCSSATNFECVGLQPGGVPLPAPATGLIDVNVCRDRSASPAAVQQIASTQPSYCRVDVP